MAGPPHAAWLTCCWPRARPLGARTLGLVLIFVTAVIWVAASFLSSMLVTARPGAQGALHAPPFLLTYLATSVFTFFLPIVHGRRWLVRRLEARRARQYKPLGPEGPGGALDAESPAPRGTPRRAAGRAANGGGAGSRSGSGSGSEDGGGFGADLDLAEAEAGAGAGAAAAAAARSSEAEAAMAAAQCFLLWFGAQLAFNVSLSMTSVTSNTILSSASSLFTFALSMACLGEPYTAAKLLSIAACIGGTVLVTLSDELAGKHAAAAAPPGAAATPGAPGAPGAPAGVWGDLLCLGSAALYAGYTIVLRRALPDDDEADVALFFGYVGLFCTTLFAPVLAGLVLGGGMDLAGVTREALGLILLQGVLNYAFSDYLWAHAVLLLGPTVATLGLSVQIPIAAAAEAALGTAAWLQSGRTAAMTLGGTALILAGFFVGHLAGGDGGVPGGHHRGDQAHPGPPPGSVLLATTEDEWDAASHGPPFALPTSTRSPGPPPGNSPRRPRARAPRGAAKRASVELSSSTGSGGSPTAAGGSGGGMGGFEGGGARAPPLPAPPPSPPESPPAPRPRSGGGGGGGERPRSSGGGGSSGGDPPPGERGLRASRLARASFAAAPGSSALE
ncbi:MAG: hypothetical protein J3K34DRAFT_524869 [Monoraphidium minutum]|nr:MAG: hypothetical protein J3K34DRAFT_524869 [Monoraphidium minutum]